MQLTIGKQPCAADPHRKVESQWKMLATVLSLASRVTGQQNVQLIYASMGNRCLFFDAMDQGDQKH